MPRVDTREFKSGTVDILTYYVMNGRQYVRKKSSLSREKVLKKKSFAKTRQCASQMGIAAKMGSLIYKSLPASYQKERWFYRAITGEAVSLLYKGKEEQEVMKFLWKKYISDTEALPAGNDSVKQSDNNSYESTQEKTLQLRSAFLERWQKQKLPYDRFKRAWPKRRSYRHYRFRNELNQAVLERKRLR